ncbi:hypothetical protein OIU34_00165 [Pararhizobium sp. BT-229]|uniref:hypothetical protein n=1 Tax=Pararhizobium sp. BT-229 TaxID=2986923 RepID=UPI0021F6D27A|nr:hypothetical protein [Pararhizobium sp. BT-229]MCV9960302.1 hypothetical protein [Pararhizobium sp. BT-229]
MLSLAAILLGETKNDTALYRWKRIYTDLYRYARPILKRFFIQRPTAASREEDRMLDDGRASLPFVSDIIYGDVRRCPPATRAHFKDALAFPLICF